MKPVFSWDPGKAARNDKFHGVTFSEAATVFTDPLACEDTDIAHSVKEIRYCVIGMSKKGNLLYVVFTEEQENNIRIISARKAEKYEIKRYEEESC